MIALPALQEEPAGTRAYPDAPPGRPPPAAVPDAAADEPSAMQAYRERIPGTDVGFDLVPLPGGSFAMGSPEDEPGRGPGEGPGHRVEVSPFWIGRTEVTWDEYHVFMHKQDRELRAADPSRAAPQDAWADAVSRPTPPYVPMDFGMGVKGCPAVGMTQFAAKQYTRWLSMKTGRFYRLPTEAEWEYACRAGSATAYSFGDDPAALSDHAWSYDNADDKYHPVATKRPNAFGLFDMHGNVAEWVLDRFDRDFYGTLADGAQDPLAWPAELYPRVVRGGSWDDDAERLRSAARAPSTKAWMVQDPQLPKSIWYHTDAAFVGLRVVRPLREPPFEEWGRFFDADVDELRAVEAKQRGGGR
jgi:formylglycine-generating enzyme required for sulfatase activity